MKVLMTGAGGYLGRHVLQALRERGHGVVVLGRTPLPDQHDLPFLACDLLATQDLDAVLRGCAATHLLHLAWVTDYGTYWSSLANFRWVEATVRLVDAFCREGGRHAVVAGTCAEYDWKHGYLREDTTPFGPTGVYGVAKDAARRLVTALCASHGASLAWGHVFYPFGPGEAPQRMLPRLVEVFLRGEPPFGINADAFRGMLYVPDAARAFVALLEHGQGGNFNICSGEPMRLARVVEVLARACGRDPRAVLDLASARPGDPPLLVGASQRLRATGWQPSWTVEQGLEDMVRQARAAQ